MDRRDKIEAGVIIAIVLAVAIGAIFSCTTTKQGPHDESMYVPPDSSTTWTLPDDTSIDVPIIDTSGMKWNIILTNIRDDERSGERGGMWHGYVNGDSIPSFWGFASVGNHTICFQMLSGAEPGEVPCTVEFRYTGGRP
jgi:hypothetical protein